MCVLILAERKKWIGTGVSLSTLILCCHFLLKGFMEHVLTRALVNVLGYAELLFE